MADKAYIIVNLQVPDFDRYFAEYIPGVLGVLAKHGGQVLVATNEPEKAEGNLEGNWHVILEFPSMDAAKGWYNDPDYKPLMDLRISELTTSGNLSFAPAFQPPG